MSLTKVTNSMIAGAPVNILDYGATGDGTTNDTAAIQAALTAGAGNVVYIPPGDYKVSSTLSIPSNTTVYGDGFISRIFRDTGVSAFDIFEILNKAHITLRDFFIDGVTKLDVSVTANRYCGIRIWANGGARPNDIEISGLHIDKTTSAEIQAEGNRGAILLEDCYDVRIERCKFYDNRATAILVTVAYGNTAINTERIQIEQCYAIGETAPFDAGYPDGFGSFISGNSHQDVLVSGCYVDGFGFSNISMNGPRSTVQNCISKNSNYAGINLGHSTTGENCDDSVVNGNITTSNNYSGIIVTASKNVVVSNNTSFGDGVTSGWPSLRVLHDGNYDPGETKNLTIIGNQFLSPATDAGATIEAGTNIQITGNLFANAPGTALFLRSKESTESMLAFVSNNVFIDNGGNGNSAVEVNTSVAGGFGPTTGIVKDNYFYSSDIATKQRWGITSAGDSTSSVQVNNNWFSSNYTGGSVNTNLVVYGYGLNQFSTSSLVAANIINTSYLDDSGLISSTTVSFAADGNTTLFTVPALNRLVLTKAVVIAGDDAGATTTISIGANGTSTDFVPANTLSNLDAANDAVILMPTPSTTPAKIKSYAAGTVIVCTVGSNSGGATNTVMLYGTFI